MKRIAVVGGGAAGVAAAWGLRRRGAEVTLFCAQAGATELGSGTADFVPWTERSSASSSMKLPPEAESELAEFLVALGCFCRGPGLVATSGGIVRSADWFAPALLVLSDCAGGRVAVADVERDDWDGRALASSLSDTEWARSSGTTFVPVPVSLMYAGHERRIAPADFAALHDEKPRAERLARKCTEAAKGCDAVLLGPWLGVEPGTLELVRKSTPLKLGEVTSPPGAAAGARFEKARSRLFEQLSIESRGDAVVRVTSFDGTRHEVSTDVGTNGPFDGIVLASGGLVGGGVSLVSSGALGGAFRLSFEAPVQLGYDGEAIDHASAAYGFDPVTAGGAWIERVGVLAAASGRGAPGIYVAGDVVADRPRTVLSAAMDGLRVARHLLES